jgi:hypothetical protein
MRGVLSVVLADAAEQVFVQNVPVISGCFRTAC